MDPGPWARAHGPGAHGPGPMSPDQAVHIYFILMSSLFHMLPFFWYMGNSIGLAVIRLRYGPSWFEVVWHGCQQRTAANGRGNRRATRARPQDCLTACHLISRLDSPPNLRSVAVVLSFFVILGDLWQTCAQGRLMGKNIRFSAVLNLLSDRFEI